MKTKVELRDGTCVTIKSAFEMATETRRYYTQKINKILEKYNKDWIGDESNIDMFALSDVDCQLYNTLFEARKLISQLEGQLLLLANPPKY